MSDKREWDVALKAIESATEAERNEYRSDIAVLRAQVQILQSAPGLSAQKIFQLDAEIARLRPYVEAFHREEDRADKHGREVDELRSQLVKARASVDFCGWLHGYLAGITGRDELTTVEGNTIRNNLNVMVFTPTTTLTDEEGNQK